MSKPSLLMMAVIVLMSVQKTAVAQSEQLTLSLQQLYDTAKEHNTSIRSFRSAIEEAKAGIKAAQGAGLPDINLSLAFSYLGGGAITDRNFGNGVGIHIPHYGNNFALQASWAVYTGGAIRTGISLSKLNAEMARVNAEENEQKVRMLLTGYYLQLHNLKNQEKVFLENIGLTETLIAHTNKRQQEGVVLKNDITRYELQLESLKQALTQVQNRAKIINHQLTTTLGLPDEVQILTQETFEIAPEHSSDEGFWQQEAAENAPALQQAELGVKISEQQVRMEKSELRPKVAVIAEEHLDGPITIEIPNINKNLNYFFVGVGVKYNLSSLYKNNRKVKQARLGNQTAKDRFDVAKDHIDNAVQAAYTDYLTTFTELETNRKSVELATENYNVIHNRYANGLALVTDMVDAANQRLDAQLKLVNSRINVLYNYYHLKFVSGTI